MHKLFEQSGNMANESMYPLYTLWLENERLTRMLNRLVYEQKSSPKFEDKSGTTALF